MTSTTSTTGEADLLRANLLLVSGLQERKVSLKVDHGPLYTVKDCAGFKFIPPGLHLFVLASSSSHGTADEGREDDVGFVRHAYLRFFNAESDIAACAWHAQDESLRPGALPLPSLLAHTNEDEHRDKRARRTTSEHSPTAAASTSASLQGPQEEEAEIVISDEHLKSLDPRLAAYDAAVATSTTTTVATSTSLAAAAAAKEQWRQLVRHITNETLLRVMSPSRTSTSARPSSSVGVCTDSLAASSNDDEELALGSALDLRHRERAQKRVWGKPRPTAGSSSSGGNAKATETESGAAMELDGAREDAAIEQQEARGDKGPRRLEFTRLDVKRSAPRGARGTELTRWTRDKSFVLLGALDELTSSEGATSGERTSSKTAAAAAASHELLGEMELAFVLFVHVLNFSALASWRALVTAFARSPSLLRVPVTATSPFTTAGATSAEEEEERGASAPAPAREGTLRLYADFLDVLATQTGELPNDFFSTQVAMPSLERSLLDDLDELRRALDDAAPQWLALPDAHPSSETWRTVVRNWDRLNDVTTERFGWEIGAIRGGGAKRKEWEEMLVRQARRMDDSGELDIEDLEEGEDAPVIVET